MPEATQETTFTATYLGKELQGRKLVHAIRDHRDRARYTFSKTKDARFWGAQVGKHYTITDCGEGVVRFPANWSEACVGEEPEEVRLALQVAQRAAVSKKQSDSKSSTPELDRHVASLRAARSQLSPTQRPVFDAWLLGKVSRR